MTFVLTPSTRRATAVFRWSRMLSSSGLLVLALIGCVEVPGTEGFLSPGDSDSEDSASSDDGGTDGSVASGEAAGPGGSMDISFWGRVPDEGAWLEGGGATFQATFWDEISSGIPGEGGIDWNSPSGPDECAATVWDPEDDVTTGGEPGESKALSAGTLTLTSPDWTVDLEPVWENGEFQYGLEMNPDYTMHFDEFYEVTTTGGSFPGFSAPEHLSLPDPIVLLSPSPDDLFELTGAEALDLEWVGGELGQDIYLELHNNPGDRPNNVVITCQVVNDGAFTVPGGLVALFSNEDSIIVMLSQTRSTELVVDDYFVSLAGNIGITASGTAW